MLNDHGLEAPEAAWRTQSNPADVHISSRRFAEFVGTTGRVGAPVSETPRRLRSTLAGTRAIDENIAIAGAQQKRSAVSVQYIDGGDA